jgi:hypothetical protein
VNWTDALLDVARIVPLSVASKVAGLPPVGLGTVSVMYRVNVWPFRFARVLPVPVVSNVPKRALLGVLTVAVSPVNLITASPTVRVTGDAPGDAGEPSKAPVVVKLTKVACAGVPADRIAAPVTEARTARNFRDRIICRFSNLLGLK